ncbi:MAG: hypothetical protein FVQ78_00540 [Solirubrobacterales bacterium]|nr:hypothetical protein [Solirubrobacterales bacterium]
MTVRDRLPGHRSLNATTAPIRRVAGVAARRLASEAGFAVPTVMLMIVAALGMAGVAVAVSVQGQGGTVRDQETKSALAVAESGVGQALLHFNRYGLVSETNPCEPVSATPPDAESWCAEVPGTTVNGGTVSYRVRPTSSELPNGELAFTALEVVSVGTLFGTTRRLEVSASSSAGQDIFFEATVQSKDSIDLDSNSEIHAGTATNGDINLASEAKQCGTATVGIGKELTGSGYYADIECGTSGGTPLEDEISLPPVNQDDAPTNNNNDRLFTQDRISGNKNTACFDGFNGAGKEDASCGPRELVIGSNSSVTLGGSVYSFCKLTLDSNSALYIAPNAEVTIYFDSPEACGYEDGVIQLALRSNSRITSAPGKAGSVAMLFVGSPDTSTKILLNSETAVDGPCEQNFVIYAPYTDIDLDSNTKFCGALAGKTVHLASFAQVWTSSGIGDFVLPLTAPHYVADRFVDCTAAAATGAPDEGC